MSTRTLLAISFYRNPHLVDNIEQVLADVLDCPRIGSVVLINDSPDDPALHERLDRLSQTGQVQYIRNPVNLGYTRAINQAYRLARERGEHLICCNSDVRFDRQALEEVLVVGTLDDRIGFVFPRSDSDPQFGLSGLLLGDAEQRRRLLPRFELTPTAVGYFLWISSRVIDRFDGFDELFSPGYEEENDLILRAGELGLRAALANHALVHHETSSSFSGQAEELKRKHHDLLLSRHPYFGALVRNYLGSARHAVYQTLEGLREAHGVVIDCWAFPGVLNGSTIYARDFLHGLDDINQQARRPITVLVNPSVRPILEVDKRTTLRVCEDPEELGTHMALIRIGQPFHEETPQRALKASAVSVNVFFDTIAQDVVSLRRAALERMWTDLSRVYREVIFISDASRRAFAARYPVRDAGLHVVYPSLDVDEYGPGRTALPSAGGGPVVVVGNQFPHKDIAHTVQRILADAKLHDTRLMVLTDSKLESHPRLSVRPSGWLSQQDITDMYQGCSLVLYPSYYEGFGLPLMEALHFRKPVIARYAPLYEELRQALGPIGQNIHLYDRFAQLHDLLASPPQWVEAACTSGHDWRQAARQILQIADAAVARFDFVQRCDAVDVVLGGGKPAQMSSAAEGIANRLHRLNLRFPMVYRVLKFIYRQLVR